jgi:predicted component of type VI protein secretion system
MKLVIEDEAGTRSIVPFTGDGIVVGRAADGLTFRLTDRNVSRRHARFTLQGGNVFVEDLGSYNGTRVNGEKIAARRKLRDGDLVQIGDYDLAVLAEDLAIEPGAPPPLPESARSEDPTIRIPMPEPEPSSLSPSWATPLPRLTRERKLRSALTAAAVALVIGLAAGWAAAVLVH